MLKLLTRLPWRKPPPFARRRPRTPVQPVADEERPLGCGWFDSSHELEHGLVVREADAQALSALPLCTWLELELRRCSSAIVPS